MQTSPQTTVNCLLCGSRQSRIVEQMSGRELRTLWRELGYEFTPGAWGPILEEYQVSLQECGACGFKFFDPALAATEDFYRDFDDPGYYAAKRPEFVRALEFARTKGSRRILDVGCGQGDFLDLAGRAGFETQGLELNRAAAEVAGSKGHKVHTKLLHEIDRDQTAGGFDLITLFQVLEHVPAPVSVLQQASALLNAGGYISVAVPSTEGIYRFASLDPAQWPPHHLSRWRLDDFATLASAAGLKVAERGGDVLFGSDIEHVWTLDSRARRVLGKRPRWRGARLAKLVSFVYRKTGMKFVFPHCGVSIYACFRQP